jgi:hypothetical protein
MVGNLRPRTPSRQTQRPRPPKAGIFLRKSEVVIHRLQGVRRPPWCPPAPGASPLSQLSQLGHTEAQILLSSAWVTPRKSFELPKRRARVERRRVG